ncbi:hypothetical protein ACSBR1_019958 [Camellia fascicularis]
MDNIVDSLKIAYQEFVVAVASVLAAKDSSGAEEFVESVKQRIGSECLVDEATGSVDGKRGQAVTTGILPISAVRLEQMSKAVRRLVIELQQRSGTAGGSSHPHPSATFDARFSDAAAQ